MARQKIKNYKKSGKPRDKSKPLPLDKTDRVLSTKTKPAGRDTCNGKLKSRDGYCQSKGVLDFHRCRIHGGKNTELAYDVFSKSLGFENAVKLESLIQDTLNMNNELASTKVMFTQALEDWQRANYVRKEYIDNVPARPSEDASHEDKELYKEAVGLHFRILESAEQMEKQSYVRAEKLVKVLVDGIAKNKKLTEGSKFTMDIKQIREILKMQLEIMAANCAGCDKLRDVIRMMREKSKDIIVDPSLSKESRKAMGAKRYGEELDKVQRIGEMMEEGRFQDID